MVNAMLIALAKFQSVRVASHQPTCMGSYLAISHTCLPCPPSGRISPACVLLPLMIRLMRNDGSVEIFVGQYDFISVGSCCCSRE